MPPPDPLSAAPPPTSSPSPPLPLPPPYRILFVGNSFTYGPPPFDRPNQSELTNLPRLFKLVAESLGRPVLIGEDTLGGCTLWTHRPSANPEACDSTAVGATCQLVDVARVNRSAGCTVPAGIAIASPTYHPCPQTLMRQPLGAWDAVVVQDQSALPTVRAARDQMLLPAVASFARAVGHIGRRGGIGGTRPRLVSYVTWAYLDGSSTGVPSRLHPAGNSNCPAGTKAGCFPFNTLTSLAQQHGTCHEYTARTQSVPCMSYALARGYAETLAHGADAIVPAGLAWLAARGAPPLPAELRAAIDAEYADGAGPLARLPLPIPPSNASDARWSTPASAQALYRDKGPDYVSKYCSLANSTRDCHVDHHPSATGMYLNALVFYATLFNASPVGAAWPDGTQVVDGMRMPAVGAAEARSLQRIARDVVLPHRRIWWGGGDGASKT